MATGLQDSFSWSGVAAAGVGHLVANSRYGRSAGNIGASVAGRGGARIGAQIGTGTASALANAATRSALDGTNFGDNLAAALPDVIAQAIGGALGNELSRDTALGPTAFARGANRFTDGVQNGASNIIAAAYSSITDAFEGKPTSLQSHGTVYAENNDGILARIFGRDTRHALERIGLEDIKIRDSKNPSAIFSRNGKYVVVDTNQDGRVTELDNLNSLTDEQLRIIGWDFSEFIDENHQKDISSYGLPVSGRRVSSSTKGYAELNRELDAAISWVRVISQFVGASISDRGWHDPSQPDASIFLTVDISRSTSKAGSTTLRQTNEFHRDKRGDIIARKGVVAKTSRYDIVIYPDYGSDRSLFTGAPRGLSMGSNASDTARVLLHEFGHVLDRSRQLDAGSPEHLSIDNSAKNELARSGLSGGGCISIGPYSSCK